MKALDVQLGIDVLRHLRQNLHFRTTERADQCPGLAIEVRHFEFVEIRNMKGAHAQTRQGKDVQTPYPAQSSHCYSLAAQHAFELLDGPRHPLLQAYRSCIEQSLRRAPPEPCGDPDHHSSHAQRSDRVRITQPGEARPLPQPGQRHAQDYHRCAPHISRKMQRVCLERLADVLPSHAAQRARPQHINSQRDAQNTDRQQTGPNRDLAKE